MNNKLVKIVSLLCVAFMLAALLCACDTGSTADTTVQASTNAPTEAATETTPETEAPTAAPTEAPTEAETEPQLPVYTVTVVDGEGNPVVGVPVQICVGDICMMPILTDASGKATFNLEEKDYTVKIPDSRYVNEEYYSFPAGSFELEITVSLSN